MARVAKAQTAPSLTGRYGRRPFHSFLSRFCFLSRFYRDPAASRLTGFVERVSEDGARLEAFPSGSRMLCHRVFQHPDKVDRLWPGLPGFHNGGDSRRDVPACGRTSKRIRPRGFPRPGLAQHCTPNPQICRPDWKACRSSQRPISKRCASALRLRRGALCAQGGAPPRGAGQSLRTDCHRYRRPTIAPRPARWLSLRAPPGRSKRMPGPVAKGLMALRLRMRA
jgi:hypothetical protein